MSVVEIPLERSNKVAVIDPEDEKLVRAEEPWHLGDDGHVINGRGGYMYKLVLWIESWDRTINLIRHLNSSRLDNRRINLSVVAKANWYTGVSWDKTWKRWLAQIHHDGMQIYLGHYEAKDDATDALALGIRAYRLNDSEARRLVEGSQGRQPPLESR